MTYQRRMLRPRQQKAKDRKSSASPNDSLPKAPLPEEIPAPPVVSELNKSAASVPRQLDVPQRAAKLDILAASGNEEKRTVDRGTPATAALRARHTTVGFKQFNSA